MKRKPIICPACSHVIEINKKTKIIRKEETFVNIQCDVCSHVIPIPKKRKEI